MQFFPSYDTVLALGYISEQNGHGSYSYTGLTDNLQTTWENNVVWDGGNPISKPSWSSLQTAWNGYYTNNFLGQTAYYRDLSDLYYDTAPKVSKAYEGVNLRSGAFPVFKNVTIASGSGVVHFTSDGTSGGSALFASGPILDSVNVIVNDQSAAYQMSWAWSNGNKTLTITANKLTTANILTGILGQGQANSAVVRVCVYGY